MSDFTHIIEEINTNLPDNTTQAITAKKLRDTLVDLTETIEDQQDNFEEEAMETIQEAIDIVLDGVRFDSGQLITGVSIVDNLIDGGENNVLSAEQGKEIGNILSIDEEMKNFVLIRHQEGGIYTYLNNYEIGDYVEQEREYESPRWNIARYTIDSTKKYYGTLSPNIPYNYSNVYVYYWADEDKKLLKKEKLYGNGEDGESNKWTNYELVPPENAKYLYIEILSSFEKRYTILERKYLTAQEIEDNFSNLVGLPYKYSIPTGKREFFDNVENSVYTYPQNYSIGDDMEQITETPARWFDMCRYTIDPEKTYYGILNESIAGNFTGVYVYYWANEEKKYISRESLKYPNADTVSPWRYKLVPPGDARYLYIVMVTGSSIKYSLEEEDTITGQDIFDELQKFNYNNAIEVTQRFEPERNNIYTYLNNYEIGDDIEQTSESISTAWVLTKYEIDPNETYYGNSLANIQENLSNYVYFWADADGKLIKKQKKMSDGSSSETANIWKDYVLAPPDNAKYLYVEERVGNEGRMPVSKSLSLSAEEIVNSLEAPSLYKRSRLEPQRMYKYLDQSAFTSTGISIEANMSDSNNSLVLKYEVKPRTLYYAGGRAKTSSELEGDNYACYWADDEGKYISRCIYQRKIQGVTYYTWGNSEDFTIQSPAGAKWLYVVVYPESSSLLSTNWINNVWYNYIDEYCISELPIEDNSKEITIWSIGNSYSQDAFVYMPILFRNIAPQIKLNYVSLMQSADGHGAGTPPRHYYNFMSNTAAYTINTLYSGRLGYFKYSTARSIKYALDNFRLPDIIFLQASASEDSLTYTNAFIKEVSKWIAANKSKTVKWGLFSAPQRAGNSDQTCKSYDEIMKGELSNLEYLKRHINSTPVEIIASPGTAIQNARTIPALKQTGSYIENSANTSGFGWLNAYDSNHISDGIGRQTSAYVTTGKILEWIGMGYAGILGDSTVMDGLAIRWWNVPSPHPSDGDTENDNVPMTNGTTADNVRLAQVCASMAIAHPTEVYDMSELNTNENSSTHYLPDGTNMEFKKIVYIVENLGSGISLSNTDRYITEGQSFSATITGNVSSISISVGNLDITSMAYDPDNASITINNIYNTVKISIQ